MIDTIIGSNVKYRYSIYLYIYRIPVHSPSINIAYSAIIFFLKTGLCRRALFNHHPTVHSPLNKFDTRRSHERFFCDSHSRKGGFP